MGIMEHVQMLLKNVWGRLLQTGRAQSTPGFSTRYSAGNFRIQKISFLLNGGEGSEKILIMQANKSGECIMDIKQILCRY